jgi:cytochrome b561
MADLTSGLWQPANRAPGWQWTGDVHGLLANYAMLILVGLHVLAGLYHYFIRRDRVLQPGV